MNVRSDGAMDNLTTTTDDDFDALLDASSLGASHVTAARGPMPELVRKRFRHVARHPEAYGEFGLTEPAVPRDDKGDAACEEVPQQGSDAAAHEKRRGGPYVLVIHARGSGKTAGLLQLVQDSVGSETPVELAPWRVFVVNRQRRRRSPAVSQITSSIERELLEHEVRAASGVFLGRDATHRVKELAESGLQGMRVAFNLFDRLSRDSTVHSERACRPPSRESVKVDLAHVLDTGVFEVRPLRSQLLNGGKCDMEMHRTALLARYFRALSVQAGIGSVPTATWKRSHSCVLATLERYALWGDVGMTGRQGSHVMDSYPGFAPREAISMPWPWLSQVRKAAKPWPAADGYNCHAALPAACSWLHKLPALLSGTDCGQRCNTHHEPRSVEEWWTSEGCETALHSTEVLNAVLGRTGIWHTEFLHQLASLKVSLRLVDLTHHQAMRTCLPKEEVISLGAGWHSAEARQRTSRKTLVPHNLKESLGPLPDPSHDTDNRQQGKLWKERRDGGVVLHAEIPGRLHAVASDHTVPLPTRLIYRPSDPFAIEAVFLAENGPVVWTFARELLAEGIRRRAGAGDVIIWSEPSTTGVGTGTAFIRLNPPEGTAQVAMPRDPVEEFLEQTKDMVPIGSEHEHHDVDFHGLEAQLSQLSRFPGGMF